MLQRLAVPALLILCGCDGGIAVSDTGDPVSYTAARVDRAAPEVLEVSVVMRNATRKIDANRFAACVAAGWAQERGFVYLERLRGTLRIEGPVHDNTVRYQLFRLTEPEKGQVFSAALTASVCEIEGIPISPEQVEDMAGEDNI